MKTGLIAVFLLCAMLVAIADPGEEGHDTQATIPGSETHFAWTECWWSNGMTAWQLWDKQYNASGFINWDYDGPYQIDTLQRYTYVAWYLTESYDTIFSDYSDPVWFYHPEDYEWIDLLMDSGANDRPAPPPTSK